jgi:hypothetical protein
MVPGYSGASVTGCTGSRERHPSSHAPPTQVGEKGCGNAALFFCLDSLENAAKAVSIEECMRGMYEREARTYRNARTSRKHASNLGGESRKNSVFPHRGPVI